MRVTKISSAILGIALSVGLANGAVAQTAATVYEQAPCSLAASVATQTVTVTAADAKGAAGTSSASSASPDMTLLPAIHWDTNLLNITNLAPCNHTKFYYAQTSGLQDAANSTRFAHVGMNFTRPSVILETSAYIKNITCTTAASNHPLEQLVITFSTREAYEFAKSSWTSIDNVVLVTHTPGCGSASDRRIFWTAQTLKFGEECSCATIVAAERELENQVTDLDIKWGSYKPSQKSAFGTASNGTSTGKIVTSNNSTCGAPPSSTVDGFPTAPCGPDFDKDLDDAIGYYNWTNGNVTAEFARFVPGFKDNAPSNGVGNGSKLSKRFSFSNPFSAVTDFVSNAGSAIANTATQAFNTVASGVQAGVAAVTNVVKNVVDTPISPSVEKMINVNFGPSPLTGSVFGQAYQLFQRSSASATASADITIYCVNCGFQGNIDIQGSLTASLLSGITAGSVSLTGNVHAGVGIGIDANAQYQDNFQKQLTTFGLPGLTVPGVIGIGPVISVSATLAVAVRAQGQILVTIAMDIPNFAGNLDLLDSSKSYSSGFTPVFSKNFQASGSVDMSANIALPVEIAVGISVPLLKLQKTIGLIETPGLGATASFVGSTNPADLGGVSCPNGVLFGITLANDVSLDFFGRIISLFPFSSQAVNTCFGGSGGGTKFRTRRVGGTIDAPRGDGARQDPTDDPERRPLHMRQDNSSISTISNNSDPENNNDGFSFISIVDCSNTFQLLACDDGNFYLDNIGAPSVAFASYNKITATDDGQRLFHYYNDTMAKYGVSRFRLSDQDSIPSTAQLVMLVEADYDNDPTTPPAFIAVSASYDVFYTVVCTIVGEYSKIFLVKDIKAGIETLKKPELLYTVTGGVVDKCNFLPFMPVAAVKGS